MLGNNPGTRHWYGFAGDPLVVAHACLARETGPGRAQRYRDGRTTVPGHPLDDLHAMVRHADAHKRTARMSSPNDQPGSPAPHGEARERV
jgi:hypothetical protein